MKEVKQAAAQGDVILRKMTSKKIPKGFVKTKRKPGESVIVTHSETGHHHVIDPINGQHVEMYEDKTNPLVCYLQMGDCVNFDVVHLRPYDTHETLRFLGKKGDVWEVRRQREHTPEGWRRVQD